MTHQPNPQNLPPERSRREMENQIAELEDRVARLTEQLMHSNARAARTEDDFQAFKDATDGERATQRVQQAEAQFKQLQRFTKHVEQERDELKAKVQELSEATAEERVAKTRKPRERKTHCIHGHELSGDNLYESPKGLRSCKACRKAAQDRARAKNRKAVEEAYRAEQQD